MSLSFIKWHGPFSFVHHTSETGELLDMGGLYVLAIRYHGKYYAYNPGIAGSFRDRLGRKLPTWLDGSAYIHDPAETLRIGRLPPPVDEPRTAGFDREKAGEAWAEFLDLFLAPVDRDRAEVQEIEWAIHRHFKWLHDRQSSFARMYDEQQEPQSGPGPDTGDHPVSSVFEGATVEGLTTVRTSVA